ncbi:phosphoribosylanthranilate isomerase [Albibacterium indicum]|uniref:phosphoribosylanthranilate isomerase n=1 Tax=Albibacterium indicum TaxID=2292082 RepID=UPI000E5449A2|nr:phosphoribosylanthranilate isomerase [Pedobacter indicus]
MNVKTKVCGLREQANVLDVAALGPDYMGFIFYPKSKRYIGDRNLDFLNDLKQIKKVAVFVDATEQAIDDVLRRYQFDAVQLHGNESPEFCQRVREKNVELIKAFGVDQGFDFDQLKSYTQVVDYFLFDTKTISYGGSGKRFDWGVLGNYKEETPYFLSGGIDKDTLYGAKALEDRRLYCIDINSRFEVEPGVKDITLLKSVLK